MRINIAGGIYGAILVGTVLAVESAQLETYAESVLGAMVALILHWLTLSYAQYTSERLERSERLNFGELAATMRTEVSVLPGAGLPLLALIASWAAAAPLSTGIAIGIWTSAATVVGLEAIAAYRAKVTGQNLAVQLLFGAFLGAGPLFVSVVLH